VQSACERHKNGTPPTAAQIALNNNPTEIAFDAGHFRVVKVDGSTEPPANIHICRTPDG